MAPTPLAYRRRKTHTVTAGIAHIGSQHDVVVQSMTNTPTLNTEASVAQIISLADKGASLVRLTAQGVAHAKNLADIYKQVRDQGCEVAISADIHFNPAAALESAKYVDKVRINPGNFTDPARTFKQVNLSTDEYLGHLKHITQALEPLVAICKKRGVALRLGVNHGSLSDRIMTRFGNTPEGMVESAMEYLHALQSLDFDQVVISIKSSNVRVMTQTVRLLCQRMEQEGMTYPLHLGVTEAGDGDDGRIKSAVGIGALLAEGLGDTIRVSLSEPPENEIPVAQSILQHINNMAYATANTDFSTFDFTKYKVAQNDVPLVVGVDLTESQAQANYGIIHSQGADALFDVRRNMATALECGLSVAPVVHIHYPEGDADTVTVNAAIDFGALLLSPMAVSGIMITSPALSPQQANTLALNILQATRQRIYKTEYIACPGCGRTLFELEDTLKRVKLATGHLKGLKIGVMGCIVNGPGEMADADFGYVGASRGHISLYKGQECIEQNIPQEQAVERLVQIIKDNGKWHEPDEKKC